MGISLTEFRRPQNFLSHVDRDDEKIFIEGEFHRLFDRLCLKQDMRVLYIDFDRYHKDEMNFPILINHTLSLHSSFVNFLSDPFKYTKNNSFKKWLFTFNDRGHTKFNINNRTFHIDNVNNVSKLIHYDMVQWSDWKVKYETFFKLVWLIDEYFTNSKFDFPMGLRNIRQRPTYLKPINQFVIHPGGTRQTIARLFGGIQPFITDDGRKKHVLKNYASYEHNIKSLDDLLSLSENKNRKRAKVDKLNSTIIYYPKTMEYEFNFNAVNFINYKIGDYVEGWFKRLEDIKTIEVLNPTPQQKYFMGNPLKDEWLSDEESPGTKLYNCLKVVNKYSGSADIEVTLSTNMITQIVILPFLIGTSFKKINTKSGFSYNYIKEDDKIKGESNEFNELYTDCYYTDGVMKRFSEGFDKINNIKPLI